ncbi:MAG TPA: hypothetical protein VLB44_19025, partial [Kofleriaceae bacterium]|nr:hypothetical protein [Kofleriaceae bacterium]
RAKRLLLAAEVLLPVLDHEDVIAVAGSVRVTFGIAVTFFCDDEVGAHLGLAGDEIGRVLLRDREPVRVGRLREQLRPIDRA